MTDDTILRLSKYIDQECKGYEEFCDLKNKLLNEGYFHAGNYTYDLAISKAMAAADEAEIGTQMIEKYPYRKRKIETLKELRKDLVFQIGLQRKHGGLYKKVMIL